MKPEFIHTRPRRFASSSYNWKTLPVEKIEQRTVELKNMALKAFWCLVGAVALVALAGALA